MLAVADTGTSYKAAERVGATQPGITMAISALEAELGAALFDRTPRGMALTAIGREFAGNVHDALTHLDRLEAQLKARPGGRSIMGGLRRVLSETHMQAFLALCEQGTYTGAAQYLGVSQPAISRSLRDLETIFGFELWRRQGATGEPTVEGRQVARAGGVCLREIEMAIENVHEAVGRQDGRLRIGALPLSCSQWVPESLIRTLRTFPDARVRIIDGPYNEQLSALHHGHIDIIVGALRPQSRDKSIVQAPIFNDPLAIVVRPGHPMLERTGLDTDKAWLAEQTWILPARGTPGHIRFLAYLAALGLPEPQHVLECGSLAATRALLLSSDFAAPLSLRQIKHEFQLGALAMAVNELPHSHRSIGITYRQGFKPTRIYQTFMAHLANADTYNI